MPNPPDLPISPQIPYAVIVLAGGRGARLGGVDKSTLSVAGRPLMTVLLEATSAAVAQVVVGDPAVPLRPGVLVTQEDPPAGGPAAGVVAGLAALQTAGVDAPWTLVLACDLPGAADGIPLLLAAAMETEPATDGACFVDATGRRQWLFGIYRTASLARAAAALGDPNGQPMGRLLGPLTLTDLAAPPEVTADIDTWPDAIQWLGPQPSDPELLVLHGVRVAGVATAAAIGAHWRLPELDVTELLLDAEARGWVSHYSFAGAGGWSLTGAGRAENERLLAAELDRLDVRPVVERAHEDFLPLNARFLRAVTDWQLRPQPGDALAANDHTDWRWDERVLVTLGHLGTALVEIDGRLADVLTRFDGYAVRYQSALRRVDRGERRWVDDVGIDSCHTVWMQLHEDLNATLGIQRGDGRT